MTPRRCADRFLAAALLAFAPAAAAGQTEAPAIAVVGGEVHRGDGEVIRGATVLIENGKIAAVGSGLDLPDGAEVIEADGRVVTPGLIDSLTLLGAEPSGAAAAVPVTGGPAAAMTPAARAADRFAEDLAPLWLREGVTTVYLSPDPRRLIGGMGAVVKLAGRRETAVVQEEAAVAASFGESAVGDRPPGREQPAGRTTRQGMIYDLRQTLIRAQEDAVGGAAGRTLGRLLAGETPLRMLVNTPDDLETALRVAQEFDLRLVLDQAAGAAAVADRLAEADIPVVVGPAILGIGDGGPMELRSHSPATAGALHRAGVRIALSTFAGRGRSVAMEAVVAWAHGLPREAALSAVTSGAAEILGVSDRVGTLAPGLDADLVIWTEHPIGTYARPQVVLVDGRVVFRRE